MSTQLVEPPILGVSAEVGQSQQFIDRELGKTRAQVKGVDVSCGLLTLLCGVLVFVLAVIVLDHWVIAGGLGIASRVFLALALIGGSVYYFVRNVLPLLTRRINPVFAAHTIEQSRPGFKNSLVNFLTLRGHREQMTAPVYQAIERQAADGLRHVAPDGAVDMSRLIRVGYVLMGVVLALALYTGFSFYSGKNPFPSIARLLIPWANIAAPTRVHIDPDSVTPGDVTVPRGGHETITAMVEGLRDDESVMLIYSTADGQTLDGEVKMTLPEGDYVYRCEAFPPNSVGVQQDMTYRITAGDATTRDYHVTVTDTPTLLIDRIEYQVPQYTKGVLRDRSVTQRGDIKAIEGTRVTIHAVANHPIESAWIDFDRGEDRRMRHEDQTASFSFTLAYSDRGERVPEHSSYRLRYKTAGGISNPSPVEHSIAVTPDLRPEIERLAPQKDEVLLPADGRMTLEFRALDPDFGLDDVRFWGQIKGRPSVDTIQAALLAKDKRPWQGQFDGRFELVPKQHGLKAGDVVTYWAVAKDNRTPSPNVAKTDEFRIRITRPESEPAQEPKDKPDGDKKDDPQDQKPGDDPQQNPDKKPGDNGEKNSEDQPKQKDEKGEGKDGKGEEKGKKGDPNNTQKGDPQDGDSKKKGKPKDDGNQGGGEDQPGNKDEGKDEQTGKGKSKKSDGNEGGEDQTGEGAGSKDGKESESNKADEAEALDRLLEEARKEQKLNGGETKDGKPDGQSKDGEPGDSDTGTQNIEPSDGDNSSDKGEAGKKKPGQKSKGGKSDPTAGKKNDKDTSSGSEDTGGDPQADGPDKDKKDGKGKKSETKDSGGKGKGGAKGKNATKDPKDNKSPGAEEANQPRSDPKTDKGAGDSKTDSSGEPNSPVQGKKQSKNDAKTDKGNKSGGSGAGGGQNAKQKGKNAAGTETDSNKGKGASDKKGDDELGKRAGDSKKADGKTGKVGEEKGKGSGKTKGGTEGGEDGPADEKKRQDAKKSGKTDGGGAEPGEGGLPPEHDSDVKRDNDPLAPDADKQNLDDLRKATDLALDHLKDKMKKGEDEEILKKLGWKRDEAQRMLDKWSKMKRDAKTSDGGKKTYEDTLRSLGLREGASGPRAANTKDDTQRGRNTGPSTPVPAEYAEQFRYYTNGVRRKPSGAPKTDGGKK